VDPLYPEDEEEPRDTLGICDYCDKAWLWEQLTMAMFDLRVCPDCLEKQDEYGVLVYK
jgi:hypothetical protein